VHVGFAGERGFSVSGQRDQLGALALDQRNDRQQFGALAGIGQRDEHVIARHHAEIAMAGFGRMHEKRGGAGAREGGSDLARDMSRLADAAHHHSPAAGHDQLHRAHEMLIEPADEIGNGLSLDFQHFARHHERRVLLGLAGAAGSRLHRAESIAESRVFPGHARLQFTLDRASFTAETSDQ
jgi:hypothetical protein